jgi:hypothetical protein
MLRVGDLIPINGRQALVCFNGSMDGKHYINVCFEDNEEYKIFEVKPIEQGFDIIEVTDKEMLNTLTAIWVEEELNDFETNS